MARVLWLFRSLVLYTVVVLAAVILLNLVIRALPSKYTEFGRNMP